MLVCASQPRLGQAHELRIRALACRPGDELRVPAHEPLRLGVHPEAELVLQAHCTEKPQGVVLEDARRKRTDDLLLEVGTASVGIDRVSAGQGQGDRVDREVPLGKVVLDPAGQWREVHGPPVFERDAPGSVPLGERKGRTARTVRVGAGCGLRIATGDVEIDHVASKQLVANCPADDPRLLARKDLLGELMHRAPLAAHAPGSSRSGRRSRS